jgi:hypothetical protein
LEKCLGVYEVGNISSDDEILKMPVRCPKQMQDAEESTVVVKCARDGSVVPTFLLVNELLIAISITRDRAESSKLQFVSSPVPVDHVEYFVQPALELH